MLFSLAEGEANQDIVRGEKERPKLVGGNTCPGVMDYRTLGIE